jgi:hypothetical protein
MALLACGRRPAAGGDAGGEVEVVPIRTVNESDVFTLEAFGAPPADTVVRISAGESRVVILRHAPPDNSPFAEVSFAAGAFDGDAEVRLAVVPGLYGLDIQANAGLGSGSRITFKYPVHFSAPAGSRQRYGSDVAFEQALLVGRVVSEGRIDLLPSTRPAADNLSAALPDTGRYLVVAPR